MSGSTGASRIQSREHFKQFLKTYEKVISKFPGFVSIAPSGSYNSDMSKTDFGDIDLITHIKSDTDKATLKKELQRWLEQLPDSVVVPFGETRYKGRRSLNTGEIVTIRYHDAKLGYSVQIDNIIALDKSEADFKLKFLDFTAEKQGLILGLMKVACLEYPLAGLFAKIGVRAPLTLPPDQEYEFNLSSTELQLRHVVYEPGTYKQKSRSVVWASRNFEMVRKILPNYNLDAPFEDLLAAAKRNLHNPRSKMRMQGVFNSMISVKSGEVGTAKGANKTKAIDRVNAIMGESMSFKSFIKENSNNGVVCSFGRMQPPTIGHGQLVAKVVETARKHSCDHVIYLSKTQDRKDNPLDVSTKVAYAKKAWPGVNFKPADEHIRTFIEMVTALGLVYTGKLYMVAGSDRVQQYQTILDKYNGTEYNFESIEVVSAGQRDPDSDGVDGMSGTKMRNAAKIGDLVSFKRGVPKGVDAEKLMNDISKNQ
jgi:hypothetical protein